MGRRRSSTNFGTTSKFAPPPFYLNPVQAKYISAVFAEVPPAY